MTELTSNRFDAGANYQSQTANVNAVTIHYLRAGTGKTPLLLIHGFGDTSHMWVPLFDEFERLHDYRSRYARLG